MDRRSRDLAKLGYRQINSGQGIETIAEEIERQIDANPDSVELRYSHINGTQFMYSAHAHGDVGLPALHGFMPLDYVRKEDLRETLKDVLVELPYDHLREVRVMKGDKSGLWGIFLSVNAGE